MTDNTDGSQLFPKAQTADNVTATETLRLSDGTTVLCVGPHEPLSINELPDDGFSRN
jgi:hypothetical protein